MTFPNVDHLNEGDEWRHPVTDQLYVVGPNGVMQKISKIAELDQGGGNTDALAALSLKVGRVEDNVDFSQNTVGKGQWAHREADGKAYPDPGEFFTKGDKINFGDIEEFTFNDVGVPGVTNPGTLTGTRVGDYLIVQVDNTNNFGYYVITGATTENIDDQHLLRTFTVKPFRDARFKGDTVFDSRCTVATIRPIYTIVQDEKPIVSERGVLWYRENDDTLLISNYGDGFVGEGEQWTELASGDDVEYLPLTGGALTGNLRTDSLIKSVRTTGKAFEVKPNDRETTGSWDQSGNLTISSSHTESNAYIFTAKAKAYEVEGINSPTAFRVTAGGAVKAGHDKDHPFLATANNDLVTKAYGDAHYLGGDGGVTGDYLPLSGGTLTGNLEMSGGYIKCLNGQPTSWFDQSGNWAAEFKGKGDKTFQMVSAQGVSIEWTGRTTNDVSIPGVKFDPRLMQWEFCNVKEPEASSDVATRKYVDEQVVAAGQSWAPTKFKFKDGGTTTTINPGEFYLGQSDGERALVIHRKAADGVDWSFFESGVDWKQDFNGPCCVRKIDGTIVFQADTVQMVTYGLPADRRHVLIKTQHSRKPIDLTNNEEYVIYIPGILPRLILS